MHHYQFTFLLILIGGSVASTDSKAVSTTWSNTSGGAWGTATNWTGSTLPTSSIDAVFNLPNNYTVNIGAAGNALGLIVNDGNINFNISSQSLIARNGLIINGGNATFSITTGALWTQNPNQSPTFSSGLYLNGGSLSIPYSSPQVNFNGLSYITGGSYTGNNIPVIQTFTGGNVTLSAPNFIRFNMQSVPVDTGSGISSLTNSFAISSPAGSSNTASLTLSNSAQWNGFLSTTTTIIGNSGGKGNVVIDGTGGFATSAHNIIVGAYRSTVSGINYPAEGTLTFRNANVSSVLYDLYAGKYGGTGTLNISGNGSNLSFLYNSSNQINPRLYVGFDRYTDASGNSYASNGSLNITDGGIVNIVSTYAGFAGGSASVIIDGINSKLNASSANSSQAAFGIGYRTVGGTTYPSTATLRILNSGNFTSTIPVTLGGSGGRCVADVTGVNSTFTSTTLYIGTQSSSSIKPFGQLNISQGAKASTTSACYIGISSGYGELNVTGVGSEFTNTGTIELGTSSGDGRINVTNGGKFSTLMSTFFGMNGIINVDGTGSQFNVTKPASGYGYATVIGNIGTASFNVRNGATGSFPAFLYFGVEGGTGTGLVDGAGSSITNTGATGIIIGNGTSSTAYTRSNGMLTVSSGGQLVNMPFIAVGVDGGNGSFNISGTDSFDNPSTVASGNFGIGDVSSFSSGSSGGTGICNISDGGQLITGLSTSLKIFNIGTTRMTGTLNISSSTSNTSKLTHWGNIYLGTSYLNPNASSNTGNGTMKIGTGGQAFVSGSIYIAGPLTSPSFSGGVLNVEAGLLQASSVIGKGTVNISANGLIEIIPNGAASGVSMIKQLNIAATIDGYAGKLDLHDNDLIVDYTGGTSSYAMIVNMVKSGLTQLGGNGTGIGSSEVDAQTRQGTVLAVVDNGDPSLGGGISSISGYTIPNPSSSILVKYTWFGDCNLDGVVDGSDYALIDTGFTSGGSLTGWVFGDVDYNGFVQAGDYALADTGFISQTGTLPEPSVLGMIGLGMLFMKRNRQKPLF